MTPEDRKAMVRRLRRQFAEMMQKKQPPKKDKKLHEHHPA
jgi:hypothetical protein